MIRTRNKFSTWLLAVLLAAAMVTAHANPATEPLEMVRSASDAILGKVIADKAIIEKNHAHVIDLINEILIPNIDAEIIARRVLADTWQTATQEQRDKFTFEFRRYMVRFYAQVFILYSGEKVDYTAVEQASEPDVRKVTSKISRSGEPPIDAAYRVELREDKWWVTDIIIDGVSLVATNRTQFKYLVARDGLDKVTALLETRNNRPFR